MTEEGQPDRTGPESSLLKARRLARKTFKPSRFEHLKRAESRRALATDVAWRLRPRPAPGAPLSWPLDPKLLADCTVRWPTWYEWPPGAAWVEPLRDHMSRHIAVEPTDLPQPYGGRIALQFAHGSRVHDVVIDHTDSMDLHPVGGEAAALYFKMQHRREGYGRHTVVPGGYVQSRSELYTFLGHLRELRGRQDFRYEVYGRFGPQFGVDVRRRALDLLRGQDRFTYEGDLKLVLIGQHLRDTARSQVCVDLPGDGPFCFRLVDYLGVGAAVVGPPHAAVMHVPLVDGKHLAYCRPDLSDLVDVCEGLLRDPVRREELRRAAQDYFDRYLRWDQLAAYYLHTLCARLA